MTNDQIPNLNIRGANSSAIHAILDPILRAGLTWLSRRRLPQTDGPLHLPGLEAPVAIIREGLVIRNLLWFQPGLAAKLPK